MSRPFQKTAEYHAAKSDLGDVCKNLAQKHNLTVTTSIVQRDEYMLDPDDERPINFRYRLDPDDEGPINFRDSKERLVASVEDYLRISPEKREIIEIGEVALLLYSHLENKEKFAEDFVNLYGKGDPDRAADIEVMYLHEKPL